MNVLSLFDGMSCGQIALERAGISVTNYYASEIDKHAIKVTMANYPNTIQLGSVVDVKADNLDKIDLLIGGSPCQGFSFAGKQLNFEDPRSKLFFEYVRILNEIRKLNPDVKFLLENVRMKKEHLKVISEALGVEPIFIDSNLVSGQNRKRYYWTNVENITLPEDKGILLKDVLVSGFVDRDKSHCLDANYWKGIDPKYYFSKSRRQLIFNINDYNETSQKQIRKNSKTLNEKAIALCANSNTTGSGVTTIDLQDGVFYRKLTPIECERLQTVPDNYTNHVSNTQRYRMLGNGWTVDVIAHIFKQLTPPQQ